MAYTTPVMEFPDKIIDHYANLIVIMADQLNIPIPQKTADGLLYAWLTDDNVKEYLRSNTSDEVNVMEVLADISGTENQDQNSVSPMNQSTPSNPVPKKPPINRHKTPNKKTSSQAKIARKYLSDNPKSNISFKQQNPKQPGKGAHARYEKYKTATNYEEFIKLGGIRGDIGNDFDRHFLHLHGEGAPQPPPIEKRNKSLPKQSNKTALSAHGKITITRVPSQIPETEGPVMHDV